MRGSAGSSTAPLTPLPIPRAPADLAQPLPWQGGELQALVQGSQIPLEAEAQGPVQCGSSPTDPLVPRAGALEALMFPFPLSEQRPGLSKEEGRAFRAQKGALLSPAWERGGLGRAQEAAEHGAHPEVPPLHVAISTSAGVGALPWLAPGSPRALSSVG